jgi:beta-galactosidase
MSKFPAMGTSRRNFLRGGAATLLAAPVLRSWAVPSNAAAVPARGPAQGVLALDDDWLFGGKFRPEAVEADFDDTAFEHVSLPHCVAPLSWRRWDPAAWQDVWIYRRHFSVPEEFRGRRLFLHFDRAMAAATPSINGHALPQHMGGFLPFEFEITDLLRERGNVLSVAVDGRWLNVPPSGSPKGPQDLDYLLPAGMTGRVRLCAFPSAFVREVFAKPVRVLDPDRKLDLVCLIDSAAQPSPARIEAKLLDRGRIVASARTETALQGASTEVRFSMGGLERVKLWEIDSPQLYDLEVTLWRDDEPHHVYRTRVGFREARFDVDGFFLNGRRTRIFGLDRHELFPYAGFAAPERLHRRDAEILRRQMNCNMVRCSHYPQSEAFLDACDELGMLVWEEVPGWWYVGDERWQKLLERDVEAMVRRDRNHPSIAIWGVRVNESLNHPDLYQRTRAIAKSLDDSRPTSGTMTEWSRKNWQKEWHQDVFAYDDYHSAPDGSVGIDAPLEGVPYLITETVGQCNYGGRGMTRRYRRGGDPAEQALQAIYHAQAHNAAGAFSRCAGVIAWCAFDYASLLNGYEGVKCPGVFDVFRIPKLGAAFYLSQVDAAVRPVIEPDFYWEFGPRTPRGPGKSAAIFSNCERLQLFVGGTAYATLEPEREKFPNLRYPPFFADLDMSGAHNPELRMDGYVNDKLVLSRSFSADRAADRFWISAADSELKADGSDSTWLMFGVRDKYGALRPFVEGAVTLTLNGPGTLVGDNPFQLADAGGAGATWIKTLPGQSGTIVVTAEHSFLGRAAATVHVLPPLSD